MSFGNIFVVNAVQLEDLTQYHLLFKFRNIILWIEQKGMTFNHDFCY